MVAIARQHPALVLGLGLGKRNGFEVNAHPRRVPALPAVTVMLTPKNGPGDEAAILQHGSDDGALQPIGAAVRPSPVKAVVGRPAFGGRAGAGVGRARSGRARCGCGSRTS